MSLNKVIEEEIKKVKISPDEKAYLKGLANKVIDKIQARINRLRIDANIFIGGSLAKDTILRKHKYDIDLFVRFNKKYSEELVKKAMKKMFRWFKIRGVKTKIKKVHGSRDYYRILFKQNKRIYVEVVPSLKVSKAEQARNITDLSYFHVNYIKKKTTKHKKLADEILLAKSFCHGEKCYGAESYIRGFSGYALELLILHYGSFKKLLQEIVKSRGQIVIDDAKHYKNKKEILENLNPAKTKSPIIIVDPTFKERNAASALSNASFEKFKSSARKFLKEPSGEFFEITRVEVNDLIEKAKEIKGGFGIFEIKTNKQPGDIAGTKLLKFARFFSKEIRKYFDIIEREFEYNGIKHARVYFVLKHKEEMIIEGPSIDRKESVANFKRKHPIWYIEDRKIKCALHKKFTIKEFLKIFKKTHKRTMKQMSIKKIKVV